MATSVEEAAEFSVGVACDEDRSRPDRTDQHAADLGDLVFDERLGEMSAAASRVARPGAAAASVRLLELLAAREPLPSTAELDAMTRAGA